MKENGSPNEKDSPKSCHKARKKSFRKLSLLRLPGSFGNSSSSAAQIGRGSYGTRAARSPPPPRPPRPSSRGRN